jgi:hypothetical protein
MVIALFFLGGGTTLASLWFNGYRHSLFGRTPLLIAGLFGLVFGLWAVVRRFRPFKIWLDEEGLTFRVGKMNGSAPWQHLDAVLLEPPVAGGSASPRLVLVPTHGVDIGVPATYTNQIDGRPSIFLAEVHELRGLGKEVAGAFGRYAGQRFFDASGLRGQL